MFDLSGRVALVTGAGQGVGEGIARTLAAQGAAVAVNDVVADRARAVAAGLAGAGAGAIAAPFDVTDLAAVADGVERVVASLGPVDVLVNNAGNAGAEAMGLSQFRDLDPAQWHRFVAVNLYGVLHCTKAVIDGMHDRRFGRIVTISSGAGVVGLRLGVSLYAAGKGGAISFMRHLAVESARSGITANTLALGLMDTATAAEGALAEMARQVPVGRLGTPDDVGAACAYLASDEAGWLTGQTINLNGGSVTS
jgi:NAD(P)-dependent dehydrogenase (short-subunit alcohol dehydrogenase family)